VLGLDWLSASPSRHIEAFCAFFAAGAPGLDIIIPDITKACPMFFRGGMSQVQAMLPIPR
jgi:hypothetical protein